MAATVTLGTVLAKVAPYSKASLRAELERFIKKHAATYGVTTPVRMAAFLAQTAHETDGFATLEEYADGSGYEGRKDLGNTQRGDGVRFKGRGIIQTTGRANYTRVSQILFGDNRLLTNPKILLQPEYAVLAGYIFWKDHNLNAYADRGDFLGMTKRINGGTNGLQERINKWAIAKVAIAANAASFSADLKKKISTSVAKAWGPIGSGVSNVASGTYHSIRFFLTGK